MRREGTLEEISDGRLYTSNDMVRAGCGGCAGCSSCCRTVGNTIILDPYDIYNITTNLYVHIYSCRLGQGAAAFWMKREVA